MLKLDSHPSGRHFLQIPGPTNVPDRVLRAIDQPTIDHRGPEFARLTFEILDGLKDIFQTAGPVVIYPASGTGAWEAALVNTLSPGDACSMFETGHFATLWRAMADKLGLVVDFVPATGAAVSIRRWSRRSSPRTRRARTRQCSSFTTKRRPA
jgi:alanine-glyoxylate transaminase/serine-glyoxylate transaminase/serine-pyruvate transaminase